MRHLPMFRRTVQHSKVREARCCSSRSVRCHLRARRLCGLGRGTDAGRGRSCSGGACPRCVRCVTDPPAALAEISYRRESAPTRSRRRRGTRFWQRQSDFRLWHNSDIAVRAATLAQVPERFDWIHSFDMLGQVTLRSNATTLPHADLFDVIGQSSSHFFVLRP